VAGDAGKYLAKETEWYKRWASGSHFRPALPLGFWRVMLRLRIAA
jgi:hypothetical protein